MNRETEQRVSVILMTMERLEGDEKKAALLFLARDFLAALSADERASVVRQVTGCELQTSTSGARPASR